MATTVQTIIQSARTNMDAVLGSPATGSAWADRRLIQWSFDLERNSSEQLRQGYTIFPTEASTAETTANTYTLDHTFEVVLSDVLGIVDDGDEKVFTVLYDLYDKADLIFKNFVETLMGVPASVMRVYEPTFEEPLLINDTEAVALIMDFEVKYRQNFSE